jgi:hypothetical protein
MGRDRLYVVSEYKRRQFKHREGMDGEQNTNFFFLKLRSLPL